MGSRLLGLLFWGASAHADEHPTAVAVEPVETRLSPHRLNVRATAALDGVLVGQIAEGEPFFVLERVTGEGCPGEGWGRVLQAGFACLDQTVLTITIPLPLPKLIDFNAPKPGELAQYENTGLYSGITRTPMLPFIYGKRWSRWKGSVWKDEAAWLAGEKPIDRLDNRHAYSFVRAIDTAKGRAFIRPNGSLVPADELYLFPLTDFHGRDLVARPIRVGTTPGWVVAREGARLRDKPSIQGEEVGRLPYQSELELEMRPVGDGRWWEISEALGAGVSGYLADSSLTRWVGAPRPTELGTDEVWVDVNLDQQSLAILHGDTPLFVTLLSSGVARHDTPQGSFRVTDKFVTNDMESLSGARERYMVEDVPWVVHFKPRYAVHTAFWHLDLGHRTSHGCINLSPKDAKTLFDVVHPHLPPGFHSIQASLNDPGTFVRIRER